MALTKSRSIAEKILPHLDADYIIGKRTLDDFKSLLERLQKEKVLSSDEVGYVKKNFNRILIELRLFHFLPEIWDEDNTERVFRQVTAVLANRMLQRRRYRTKEQVSGHLKEMIDEVLTSHFDAGIGETSLESYYQRLVDEFLNEARNEKKDPEVLAMIIREYKERLVELPKAKHTLIYKLDRLARQIKNGSLTCEEGLQQLEQLLHEPS